MPIRFWIGLDEPCRKNEIGLYKSGAGGSTNMVHLPHVVPNPSLLRSNQTRYSEHERKLNPSLRRCNPTRYSIPFGCKGTKNINILQAKRHKKSKMGISSSIPGHRQIEVVSSFLVIPLVRAISF